MLDRRGGDGILCKDVDDIIGEGTDSDLKCFVPFHLHETSCRFAIEFVVC